MGSEASRGAKANSARGPDDENTMVSDKLGRKEGLGEHQRQSTRRVTDTHQLAGLERQWRESPQRLQDQERCSTIGVLRAMLFLRDTGFWIPLRP